MEMTSYVRHDQTCVSLMVTVARPAFSVFPNKYMQSSLNRNRGKNKTSSYIAYKI
jgi:hypothetical protein